MLNSVQARFEVKVDEMPEGIDSSTYSEQECVCALILSLPSSQPMSVFGLPL